MNEMDLEHVRGGDVQPLNGSGATITITPISLVWMEQLLSRPHPPTQMPD